MNMRADAPRDDLGMIDVSRQVTRTTCAATALYADGGNDAVVGEILDRQFDPTGVRRVDGSGGIVRSSRETDEASDAASAEPATAAEPATPADEARLALFSLCEDLRFETAGLYARTSTGGWRLLIRVGPDRPWHAVIDPAVVEVSAEGRIVADLRSLPGVGPRLASLGCGSLAVFPLTGGNRVLLDSGTVHATAIPQPDRALLGRLGRLAAAETPPPDVEVDQTARLSRLARELARAVQRSGSSVADLAEAAEAGLSASRVLLVDASSDVPIVYSPGRRSGERAQSAVEAILRLIESGRALDPAVQSRLAAGLGLAPVRSIASPCDVDGAKRLMVVEWPADVPPQELTAACAHVTALAWGLLSRGQHQIDRELDHARRMWAHSIHDRVTQSVTAAVHQIELLKRQVPDAAEQLEGAQDEIRESLADLRGIISEVLEGERVEPDHTPLQVMIQDIVRRWRLPARVVIEGDLSDAPESLLPVAQVVVREALTNAARHASATLIVVRVLSLQSVVHIEVTDNGGGFDPSRTDSSGFGMGLMRARIAESGGTIDIRSGPGKGTTVIALIPRDQRHQAL